MFINSFSKITAAGVLAAAAALTISLLNTNLRIKTTEYEIANKHTFLNIVHLSDLHNYEYGHNNDIIINKIKNIKPDIIIATGDMIDAHYPDFKSTYNLFKELLYICPCVYIEGNHEYSLSRNFPAEFQKFIFNIKEAGVKVLKNDVFHYSDEIDIYGLKYRNHSDILKNINKNKFNIVCYHSPERVNEISEHEPNLILIGHTHGGQVYIPGIGRLFTHGEGLKAKYISGKNKTGNSTVITSNGLGSSKAHFLRARVNVPPEIVNINLKKE